MQQHTRGHTMKHSHKGWMQDAKKQSVLHSMTARRLLAIPLLLCVVFTLSFFTAHAVPQGADVVFNSTGSALSNPPGNRTDDGGTITTVVLDTLQQNNAWKGYVGNVTGRLALNDGDGFTLYDWAFEGVTITGEVYAARTDLLDFSSVECANTTTIQAEELFHNMTTAQADSITNTFNYTLHSQFSVGAISGPPNTIAADSCPSTATYVDDVRQAMDDEATTVFQEILLQDASTNMLYVTLIEDAESGYRDDGTSLFDFQLIVPESTVKSTPTTYFFFLEIS